MDKMIGLNSFLHPKIPSSSRIPLLHIQPNLPLPSFPLKISKKTHLRFLLSAQTNNSSSNPTQEPKEPAQEINYESSNNNGGGSDLNKDQPPPLINIKWGDLLLNPNPDNILAVGLTGILFFLGDFLDSCNNFLNFVCQCWFFELPSGSAAQSSCRFLCRNLGVEHLDGQKRVRVAKFEEGNIISSFQDCTLLLMGRFLWLILEPNSSRVA
ncbi:hypothetical protein POTOM_030863 [Populus tomentosa]|uniref:Uncharacterized protein n=1 Tax=Populus tomentosa TaxID=118781 RepID=A0A8X8CRD3_POPTO|nr:hypothetical protein POTOM_030863 [Populus tomentosa]